MDQEAKLQIFKAQTENVRSLMSSMRQVHRSVNEALREEDTVRITTFTKTYALLFCGWSEANFSKVLHTPYGFELTEISQVLEAKSNGISAAWKKCVELGLRHLDAKRGSFRPNAKQKLDGIIEKYVFDPSLLRNKLAHGQWMVALNRKNDAVQCDLTQRIENLNITQIDSWIHGHKLLAGTVETLIESPTKTFVRDWYQYVVDIEASIEASQSRSIEEHIRRIKKKHEKALEHKKITPERKLL
jgi:hypothetical protein